MRSDTHAHARTHTHSLAARKYVENGIYFCSCNTLVMEKWYAQMEGGYVYVYMPAPLG